MGVIGAASPSAIVAVQEVELVTITELGVQLRLADVEWCVLVKNAFHLASMTLAVE